MTVCIGALCSDEENHSGHAVVVASDRMVTWGLTEFEHEIPKLSELAPSVVALIAGDSLRGADLVRATRSALPPGSATVQQVADLAASGYGYLRRQYIDRTMFHPRGFTLEQFYQGAQSHLLPHIAGTLDVQVAEFDYGVQMLLAGVDDRGAHLYSICNPGLALDHEPIGFTAIGIGAGHAIQALISLGHTPTRDIHRTVFSVYLAKRRAEVAPGVGSDTDLAILYGQQTVRVSAEVLGKLADLYQEHEKTVAQQLRARVDALPLCLPGVAEEQRATAPPAPIAGGVPPEPGTGEPQQQSSRS